MRYKIITAWTFLCCTALLTVCTAEAATLMTIDWPKERQVAQRNGEDQATLLISGSVKGAVDLIEVKADLTQEAKRGKPFGWTQIAQADDIETRRFTAELPLQAGGWYTISIRATKGGHVVAETKIEKVGAGDVFITAGQSNSANYGRPRQEAKDDRVVYFDGTNFLHAKDPIPGACGSNGSVWSILGDLIVRSQEVPVCFRSASLTWTEVKNWMPDKPSKLNLYGNLVKCSRQFGKGGVRAVLWHQGESDSLAKTSAETYCSRLRTIIESLNRDVQYDIPWFVAQASFHPRSKKPEEDQVARGQQLLWERGIAHKGPVTDDLGQEYRCDGVHFNQLGLTKHAERWFNALADYYKWKKNELQ